MAGRGCRHQRRGDTRVAQAVWRRPLVGGCSSSSSGGGARWALGLRAGVESGHLPLSLRNGLSTGAGGKRNRAAGVCGRRVVLCSVGPTAGERFAPPLSHDPLSLLTCSVDTASGERSEGAYQRCAQVGRDARGGRRHLAGGRHRRRQRRDGRGEGGGGGYRAGGAWRAAVARGGAC